MNWLTSKWLPLGVLIRLITMWPFYTLHILCFLLSPKEVKHMIHDDLLHDWEDNDYLGKHNFYTKLIISLLIEKDFRAVYYIRLNKASFILSKLLSPVECMMGQSTNIAEGFRLIHGFGTVINGGVKIGKHCTCLHHVTIGAGKGGCPTIGDDVYIGAGAIIIGKCKIGNHVKIGAGAVVVDDISDYSTVVGPKAEAIQKL